MEKYRQMTIAEASMYIRVEDMEVIASKYGITKRAVQLVLSGATKRSVCIPLILEIAKLNKEEMMEQAKEIKRKK